MYHLIQCLLISFIKIKNLAYLQLPFAFHPFFFICLLFIFYVVKSYNFYILFFLQS